VLSTLYDITGFDGDGYQYSLVRSCNRHGSLLHGTLSAWIAQIKSNAGFFFLNTLSYHLAGIARFCPRVILVDRKIHSG
jgi:hypothetical protein